MSNDATIQSHLAALAARAEALKTLADESISYLNHPVRFDIRRAGDLLAAQGLRCPRFDEYVGAMVAFFREHEEDAAFAPASP